MSVGYSILVPVYNNDKYLEECLDSIQLQTYFNGNENYQILVGIDGCEKSRIKIMEIYNKYHNLTVLNMEKNMGVYVNLNTLLSVSIYDNIIVFGSDDIMKPNLIETINPHINKYSIIKFGRCDFTNQNDKCQIKPPTDGVLCFNKNVLKKLGGYKNWICGADTDFMYRLSSEHKILILRTPLYYRRIHTESLTQNINTNFASKIRLSYIEQLKRGVEYIKPVINTYQLLTPNNTDTNGSNLNFTFKSESNNNPVEKKKPGDTSGSKVKKEIIEPKPQELPKPTQVVINTPIVTEKSNLKKLEPPKNMQKPKGINKIHSDVFMGKSMKKKLRFGKK